MYFRVAQTAYGGRGCVATQDIPAGTAVHVASTPFASVIFRDFKKEVCGFCFAYDLGRAWNVRLKNNAGGLWFCSDECRDRWIKEEDPHGTMAEVLDAIDVAVALARKKLQTSRATEYDRDFVPEDFDPEVDDIDSLWAQVDSTVSSTNVKSSPLRNPVLKNRVLVLEDVEHNLARLVAVAILRLCLDDTESWHQFSDLQSHERDLIARMPDLLESHVRVFLFLKVLLPATYQPYITTANVRSVLGREAANAFGIWQLPLHIESECLGSAIFPSASYFNHSCDPNVLKTRVGRQMHFSTSRLVRQGEELCISYGMILDMDCAARRQLLREQWYFDCSCPRCASELG